MDENQDDDDRDNDNDDDGKHHHHYHLIHIITLSNIITRIISIITRSAAQMLL